MTNRLADQPSPYLREAADQPVPWWPWCDEAFEQARREGKPVLVDSGAVWCHWCHVMDHESYEDEATAKRIAEHFIAIKLDRDERPDIDARLQASVGALTGRGGWPLTAFLTPDGEVFYGGTYFPPKPAHGMPAFRDVLDQVAHFYADHPDDARAQAAKVREALARSAGARGGSLAEDAFDRALDSALGQHDPVHGGFGQEPKFPHAATTTLLLQAALDGHARGREAAEAAFLTLERMGAGGIYDHLEGGFHRYSVDARWTVPHFEKMLYDNGALLGNYVEGAIATRALGIGDPGPLEAKARDIVRFLVDVLEQPGGGLGGSQDADRRPDGGGVRDRRALDDGDYFTWTPAEMDAVLTRPEGKLARARFGVEEHGDMHHDRSRNVLELAASIEDLAAGFKRDEAEVAELLASAQKKLLAARHERKAPFVDPTVYTSWNGLAIAALAELHQRLGAPDALAAAERAMTRLGDEAWTDERGFLHAIGDDGARVAGLLEDQAIVLPALLALFHATGDDAYLTRAEALADLVLARFVDDAGRLTTTDARETPATPADQPTPAAPALFWLHLPRLARLVGRDDLEQEARNGLEAIGGELERLDGIFGATLHLAARALLDPPPHIVVTGEGDLADALHEVALRCAWPLRTVLRVSDPEQQGVPVEAQQAARAFEGQPIAVVCRGNRCEVAQDAAALRRILSPSGPV